MSYMTVYYNTIEHADVSNVTPAPGASFHIIMTPASSNYHEYFIKQYIKVYINGALYETFKGKFETVDYGDYTDQANVGNLRWYMNTRTGHHAYTTLFTVPSNAATMRLELCSYASWYTGEDNEDGEPIYRNQLCYKNIDFTFNQPPSEPLDITYGQPQAGRQLTLTTSGSTDDDGDEITYVFERSIDGGVYTEVGQTIELSINDTIPTTGTTYTARVKAVDSAGGESAYVVGEPMAINYNSPPVISGTDANLGTVNAPPVYNYTVTDADGGAVTVVEKVTTASGKEHTLRTYTATLGAQTSVKWNCHCWVCCENGMNTLTITATDSSGAKAVRTVRFYREVGCIMAARAVATDAMPTKVFLSLYPAPVMLPGDCTIEAYVTNNPFDDSPVWEDIGDKLNMVVHTFANSTCKNGYGIGYKFCINKGEEKVYFDQATLRFA